jgi:TonB-linked SusC/RagA family outer membrane protein
MTDFYSRLGRAGGISIPKKVFLWGILMMLAVAPQWATAQTDRTVSGTVSDEKGESLPGVTILVKGTQQGTTTDMDGKFNLRITSDNPTLVFSFVGFMSREIAVGNESQLSVSLESDTKALDELVVVGYGTMKKSDLTGSVVRVNLDEKQNQANVNIMQALTGAAPGINIENRGGASAEPSFSIRGQNSLSASNAPLIVIDDIIYNGSLSEINVNDVETIDVLKDASAVSVYGSRSANGVIIITTKTGKSDKPRISFNTYHGFQKMTNNPMRVMNGDEFAQRLLDYNYQSQLYQWYGTYPTSADGRPVRPDINNREVVASYLLTEEERNNYLAGREVDWVKAVTRTAPIRNYDVSLSGKNGDKLNYFVSGAYNDVDGILINDQFKRLTLRANLESRVNNWLKLSFNSAYAYTDESGTPASLSTARAASPLANNYIGQPNYDIYLGGELFQPYPLVNTYINNLDKTNQLQMTGRAKVDIPWIEGLSYDLNYSNRFAFLDINSYHNYNTPSGVEQRGMATKAPSQNKDWILNNIVNYTRSFDKHSINATFLYTRERRTGSASSLTAMGFDNEVLGYNNMGLGTIARVASSAWQESSIGVMGRVNYSYNSKYILTGTFRRDGYSGFGAYNKWADFPSLSLAWVFSEEEPFKAAKDYYGKLRVSYGINGNQGVGRYGSLSRMATRYYVYGQAPAVGLYPSTLGNSSLSWETTGSFNAGIDYGFLNNRITGSVDFYTSKTKDVLVRRQLPPTAGYDNVWANIGGVSNNGVDFMINSKNLSSGDLRWETGLVFSLNRSKITRLYGGENDSDPGNGWFVGEPISSIYDFRMSGGVWTEQELFSGNIPYRGWFPGQFRYDDLNGDNTITPEADRTVIGYTEPNYRFSITNSLSYKGFNLSVMLNSIQGGSNYYLGNNAENINPRYYMPQRMNNSLINPYWSPDAPTTNTTGIYNNPPRQSGIYQSRSFVRLQDVSLSYNLSPSALKTLGLANLSLYVSAKNPYVWTKWQGWDPETGLSDTPLMRSFIGGVRFSF